MGAGSADPGVNSGSSFGGAPTISPSPLRRGSILSGERAVFKPVVDRIEALELQVNMRDLPPASLVF